MNMEYPHAYTLKSVFEKTLNKHKENVAIWDGEQSLTYGELDKRSNAISNALVRRGVDVEDPIGIMMSNTIGDVVAEQAIIKSGAAEIRLNDMLSPDEVEYMLNHSEAKVVICNNSTIETISEISERLDHLEHCVVITDEGEDIPQHFESLKTLEKEGDHTVPPDVEVMPDHIASHSYTSGTTGKPKCALRSHECMTTCFYGHVMETDLNGDEHLLFTTPMAHATGIYLRSALLTGAKSLLRPEFDVHQTLRDIDDHDITWTFMVPTMIYRVLDQDLQDYDLSSLKTVAYGAAPIKPDRLQDALEAFGPIFLQTYGQTEIINIISSLSKRAHEIAIEENKEERLSSAGQLCLMADAKIVDPDTGEELDTGEVGEIVATAPYSMDGYLKMPEKTAKTMDGNWIYTGDIGKFDDDGYLYLLDRKSNMIVTGGLNVYSTEVEKKLNEFNGIENIVIVGIPDDEWGESIKAVIVPESKGNFDLDEFYEFADKRLANYKKPKSVDFINKLPTTEYGKIDRKQIRQRYWENQERNIG
jgi:fatty-acyl-CoA synthase/long-chain acyl-CoA synthetase